MYSGTGFFPPERGFSRDSIIFQIYLIFQESFTYLSPTPNYSITSFFEFLFSSN
jgi:hypothetical protein